MVQQFKSRMKTEAYQVGIRMPPQADVAREVLTGLLAGAQDHESVRQQIDSLIVRAESEIHVEYKAVEQEYARAVVELFLEEGIAANQLTTVGEVVAFAADASPHLDDFYMSLAQSRKSRAGTSLQDLNRELFELLGYPLAPQPKIDGNPDFLFPSVEHYRENPMDCLVFTSKRTLRERWRQIVTEGAKGLGFFLATIDPKIPATQFPEMLAHRIYVVCPESVRAAKYDTVVNAISYRQFMEDHLDPAMERWKRNGIIA